MNIFVVIFQAIVQGLSEFLPISSSGHLSLVQHFTGVQGDEAVLLTVMLHMGTLIAVIIAFHRLIWDLLQEFGRTVRDIFTGKFHWKGMNPERRMIFMLIISCAMLLPFYIFKDFFTTVASDNDIVLEGFCFLYTAAILYLSDRCVNGQKTYGNIRVSDAVRVGIFQGFALLPGVSRSGSTIAGGLFSGFKRETAVQYSFVLGIPPILLGGLLELKDYDPAVGSVSVFALIVGFVVAAVVGFLAIKVVSWLIRSDKFKYFAYYTALLGIVTLLIGTVEHIMA